VAVERNFLSLACWKPSGNHRAVLTNESKRLR
jgi:hypothetical protein